MQTVLDVGLCMPRLLLQVLCSGFGVNGFMGFGFQTPIV